MTGASKMIRVLLITAGLSAVFAVGASAATLGAGKVSTSALRLRSEPSTEASILATASEGSQVVVLGAAGNGWYKVDFNTIEGYMSADHLSISASAEASLGYAYINIEDGTLNLRSGPGTDYTRLTAIPAASVVPISGISGAWYKVSHNGQTGYISSEYVLLVQDASGTRADGNGVSAAALSAASSSADQLITYAKQFIGTPYVYGANGPKSFDCSGFTKYIFAQFGVSLNRTATNQLSNGVSVTRSQLQPGDLVFFKYRTSKPVSHVGIYIGGGKFIHASTNSYRVCIDDMSSGHYYNVFVYGRRVL